MPFKSKKQRAYLHAKEPAVAKKWEAEAKRKKQPAVQPKRKKKRA